MTMRTPIDNITDQVTTDLAESLPEHKAKAVRDSVMAPEILVKSLKHRYPTNIAHLESATIGLDRFNSKGMQEKKMGRVN